jgi:hypothetical protein
LIHEYEYEKIVVGVPLRRKGFANAGLDPEIYDKYKNISWTRKTQRSTN